MRLSSRGRYALTSVMDLVMHQHQGAVTLGDISARQGVSLSYLEQLFAQLRKTGLVQGVRGPGGGYRLTGSAETISVAAVVLAVERGADRTDEDAHGRGGERCLTHELWSELSEQIQAFLDGITLADLAWHPDLVAAVGSAGANHPDSPAPS
jgi:Rrf2 family iron-sulfur cluster assembly transcriptional regulator